MKALAVIVTLLLLAVGASFAVNACNSAQLDTAPDGSNGTATCNATPTPFCDAMAPSDPSGCTGDPNDPDFYAQKLQEDASYAEGCKANLVDQFPDEFGDCNLVASCTCQRASDAGVVDAGPDAEAGSGPVYQPGTLHWMCNQ